MTKKELLEKLRKKNATPAPTADSTKKDPPADGGAATPPAAPPAAAAGDNAALMDALKALDAKLDTIGEAVATFIESAGDKKTDDEEEEDGEKPVDDMTEEEMEKELEETTAALASASAEPPAAPVPQA